VAAVDAVVTERSFARLLSLLEAALWVAGGLLVAKALHLLPTMPAGYAVSMWTVIGGVLLGLGAFVNGACVFGAIARFGSGEWAYILTPAGFFVGCLSIAFFAAPAPQKLPYGSPVLQAPTWVALLFVAFALWRIATPWLRSDKTMGRRWHEALAEHVWSPHAATTVIGVTFVVMLLLVGGWAYTDVLAELARGMSASVEARTLLLLALVAGAALGGWTAKRFRSTRITLAQVLRCFSGGVLMGWGSLLLPGGNDGLILVGMPLAWPYAWTAFATMCAAIATAQLLRRSVGPPGPPARRAT
jgi:toxin CptA